MRSSFSRLDEFEMFGFSFSTRSRLAASSHSRPKVGSIGMLACSHSLRPASASSSRIQEVRHVMTFGGPRCLALASPTSRVQRQYRLRLAAVPVISSRASLVGRRLASCQNGSKWQCSWLENSAQIDVDVPLEEAWALWENRERIPAWMPWISSVKVQADNPTLSRWTLSTYQFNRQWEFSWLALNMTPLKYQKIHWRSVPGSVGGSLGSAVELQNRGQIRFFRKSPTQCTVKLTISYEVPAVLAPFANLLTPLVEGVLQTDMKRFAQFALQHRPSKA